MRTASYTATAFESGNKFKFVHDWVSMGVATGVRPYKMAYVDRNRRSHVQRHVLKKGRITWESSPTLKSIQLGILGQAKYMFETVIPERDKANILAYRSGVDPIRILKFYEGVNTLIKFDIRKYFDNIKFRHLDVIWKKYFNMGDSGSRLFSKYVLHNGSLQQGSVASPTISNFVGYEFIDRPLKAWLKETYPNVDIVYFRFCDNIVLFSMDDSLPENFYSDFKEFTKKTLKESGFHTHMWDKIGRNNPKKNIHWLGAVFGKSIRYDKHKYDLLRAELFGMLMHMESSQNFLPDMVPRYGGYLAYRSSRLEWYRRILRTYEGRIAHIKRLNADQGLALQKLLKAVEGYLFTFTPSDCMPDKIAAAKRYKDRTQTVEEYLLGFNNPDILLQY